MAKPSSAVIAGVAILAILMILCICSIISSIFASINSGTTPPTPGKEPVDPDKDDDPDKDTPDPEPEPDKGTTPTPVPAACGSNKSCVSYITLASNGDVSGYNSKSVGSTSLQACQDLCTKEKCTWLSWVNDSCILKTVPTDSSGTNIFNTVGTSCTYITPGTHVTGKQTHSRDKNDLNECKTFCDDNPNDCDFAWWDPSEKMCYSYNAQDSDDGGYVSYFPVGAVCSSTWGK